VSRDDVRAMRALTAGVVRPMERRSGPRKVRP
jgi:hypothetical protein